MVHSTARFAFEFAVLDWAIDVCQLLWGDQQSFLLELDSEGKIIRLESDSVEPRGAGGATAWLYSDPYDAPEHTYLAWQGISRPMMQRLAGYGFSKTLHQQRRRATGNRFEEFHKDWIAMF